MGSLTFEIQHADFECTAAEAVSPEEGVRRVQEHDWDGEYLRMEGLFHAKDEFCPPGVFLRKDDGSFLHVYRPDRDGFNVRLTIPRKRKLLGLIPITSWPEGNWRETSLAPLMQQVRDYATQPNDRLLESL